MRGLLVIAMLVLVVPGVRGQDAAELQRRAIAAWERNDLPGAEKFLRQILQVRPGDVSAMSFLAAVLDAGQHYDEADGLYRKAILASPRSVALLNNYGNHCAQQGDEKRASAAYLQVIQIDPAHRNANLQLARMAVNHKDGAEALERLRHIANPDPSIRLLRAEALFLSGKTQDGEAALQALLQERAGDGQLLLAVGMLEARMHRYDAAEQALSQAVALSPGDPDAMFQLGTAAALAGHSQRAIGVLETVRRSRPSDTAVLSALGRAYAMENDFPHAIELLSEVRKLAPKDTANLVDLAHILDAAGDTAYAVIVYDELVALDPGNETFRFDRALDYAGTGKYDQAVAEFNEHIARHPKDAQGYFRLALVTEQRDNGAAVLLLNKALDLDASFLAARYERGVLLRRLGRLQEAAPDLQRCAEADPDNVEAQSQLGGVLISLGRAQEAVVFLQRARALAPDDRGILMHLGKALSVVGKESESQEVLNRLEALGPTPEHADESNILLARANLAPAQRLGEKIARMQHAVDRRPDDAVARLRLGNALLEAGRKSEASEIYRGIRTESAAIEYGQAQGLERSDGAAQALAVLDGIEPAGRNGEYFLYRSQLLMRLGKDEESCATLRQNLPVIGSDPHRALSAAVLEIRCGQYGQARELARSATELSSSMLVDAVALHESKMDTPADAALHTTEACWPGWGKPYSIEGAILSERGQGAQALAKLSVAQSLGEDTAELTGCIHRGGQCQTTTRRILLDGIEAQGAPETPCPGGRSKE